MSNWAIEMKDGWKPGDCGEGCAIFNGCDGSITGARGCPLSIAKKMWEIKEIAGYSLKSVSGGRMYAVED